MPNNILQVTRSVDVTGRAEPVYSHTIQVREPTSVSICNSLHLRTVSSHDSFVLFKKMKLMMPKKEFELFKVGRRLRVNCHLSFSGLSPFTKIFSCLFYFK